ncbi:DUF4270 domain-containing protein [Maribacter sp. HTCC2170]|uniref:DUF4270 domain-containing protein n=1 Tax=Maribacter sp. (strain HTCC2170 / KCCM 42371) TaxID=313603 RepID=UPI00006B3AF8|nr:DUF4270 domain-containing protein [Maribacter sp. HTCC2170]EAQ99760.1 hypothetical protein FB2170_07389 [Maribacter sp. HTCC2170]
MSFFKRLKFPAFAGFLLVLILASCENDITTIGAEVIGGEPFTTDKAVYDVFAYNNKVEAVRTNKLPHYQLGIFNDPIYGKTEARITSQLLLPTSRPKFGVYSQEVEDNAENDDSVSTIDENEIATEVFLYIPYLRNLQSDTDGDGLIDELDSDPEDSTSDTDGDGVSDNQEKLNGTDPLNEDTDGDGINDDEDDSTIKDNFAKKIDLDSIYINNSVYNKDVTTSFNIKVERSTYFLRDLDPNTNFQEAQEYYSTQQFSPSFVSDLLYEGEVIVSNEQILIDQEDDPNTEEVDESGVSKRLEPGIRVPLDIDFFQANIIDREDGSEMVSQANFNEFMRGIHLSTSSITDDVMLLLDMKAANITIGYNYDSIDLNETADDTSDDEIVQKKGEFIFSMLRETQDGAIVGNAVNTFENEIYPGAIDGVMDAEENASRIYLKGGSGTYSKINLFSEDEEEAQEVINQIKAENWIINEANLVFYIDQEALEMAGGIIEPPRLYLHNAESKAPLINTATENSNQETIKLFGLFQNYDGIINKSSDDKGEKYTVRITDHINNLIIRDSTSATLGLTLTPDIEFIGVSDAMFDNGEEEIPVAATLTPLGTVLYGSEIDDPAYIDKKLKLEIFYTKTEQ